MHHKFILVVIFNILNFQWALNSDLVLSSSTAFPTTSKSWVVNLGNLIYFCSNFFQNKWCYAKKSRLWNNSLWFSRAEYRCSSDVILWRWAFTDGTVHFVGSFVWATLPIPRDPLVPSFAQGFLVFLLQTDPPIFRIFVSLCLTISFSYRFLYRHRKSVFSTIKNQW